MGRFWLRRLVFLVVLIGVLAVAASVVKPIGDGAGRVLKPVDDLAGWVGDNLDAKRERDVLEQRRQALERDLVDLQIQDAENRRLQELVRLNAALDLDQYGPVQARVAGRAQQRRPTRVRIDRGREAGIRAGQPVVAAAGLVGRVTDARDRFAIVTLIVDPTFGTGAVVGEREVRATVEGSQSRAGELELTLVNARRVARDDAVVTSGSTSPETPSFYPAGLPVGRVTRIVQGDGALDARIRVRPVTDLVNMRQVEVLTRVGG